MQCPRCNRPLEEDATFCGFCGNQLTPLQARGSTVGPTDATMLAPNSQQVSAREQIETVHNAPGMADRDLSAWQAPSPRPVGYVQPETKYETVQTPQTPSTPPARRSGGNRSRIILFVVIALVIIAGGTIGGALFLRNAATTAASGQVTFFDSQGGSSGAAGDTDALTITINNLAAPPSGSQYNAWLINSQNEQIIVLGTLVQNGQTYTLRYTGDGSHGHGGTNLLGAANRLEVTQEQGSVSVPSGKVILAGTFPPLAFVHIRHLLFSFPSTPHKIGLLVGLLGQTQLLTQQAQSLQNTSANNTGAIQCIAQSIINIIEGVHGDHYQTMSANCGNIATGDGFGLLGKGYLITAAQHAALAASQSDSTDHIRLYAGHVETAMTNITGWATAMNLDALNVLANPNDNNSITGIVKLANQIYNGVDINGDGHVDPVVGEAGAITAYLQGQIMAQLPLIVPA